MELTQYTFTFENKAEGKFREILSRLEPDEYIIVEDINKVPPKNENYSQHEMQTIMEMDSEAALTFRLGMRDLKIKRTRTVEEEAEKKALEDQHRITIRVKVDGLKTET